MNFSDRLERLRRHLRTLPCDALLIEHPTDLLYLTGLVLSAGKLLVSYHATSLIVDGRYSEQSSRQTLYPVELLKEGVVQDWLAAIGIKRLGFDQTKTTYQAYASLMQMALKRKESSFPLEIVPVDSPVMQLRLIKDPDEIEALRQAARLGYQGYEYLLSLLCEGITEKDLALELEYFWKKRGASRVAFEPTIAFGSNGSMPHYRAGDTKLVKGMPILMDIGVVLDHYHSDMTRVHFFGEPPSEIKAIYSVVEEAKERAFAHCHPGVMIGELDRVARDWIASKGYGELFIHSLGHGIGLDIHEPPILRQNNMYAQIPLQAGMVITIEPGVYLPGIGGVRLEDTILITENGYENFYSSCDNPYK